MFTHFPFRIALTAAVLLGCSSAGQAQLKILSKGNLADEWRSAQLESIQAQLTDAELSGLMHEELSAQLAWLNAWKPGSLTEESPIEQRVFQEFDPEPIIDPERSAAQYRARLLGDGAQPTAKDTDALRDALTAQPADIGLRQLHLHWLDQIQFRKKFTREIVQSANRLAGLLEAIEPETDALRLAKGFCYFRSARALAYYELPDVLSQQPIDDPQNHEAALLESYRKMLEILGDDRPEVTLLVARMLRRDGWFGRSLLLLEQSASSIDQQWYLKKRRDLLRELTWSFPADEAARIYARLYPAAVAEESKQE
jgi:hypothetical protein